MSSSYANICADVSRYCLNSFIKNVYKNGVFACFDGNNFMVWSNEILTLNFFSTHIFSCYFQALFKLESDLNLCWNVLLIFTFYVHLRNSELPYNNFWFHLLWIVTKILLARERICYNYYALLKVKLLFFKFHLFWHFVISLIKTKIFSVFNAKLFRYSFRV